MRSKTRQILDELSASKTKATLMAFWSDLRALDREQFEAVISAKGAKTKRSTLPKQAIRRPVSDGPIQRISCLMLSQCAFTPDDAALALKQQLVRQKIPPSRVPPFQGGNFERWLAELFKAVPSSKVLHAAVALSAAGGGGVR